MFMLNASGDKFNIHTLGFTLQATQTGWNVWRKECKTLEELSNYKNLLIAHAISIGFKEVP